MFGESRRVFVVVLRLGKSVRAIGAGFESTLTPDLFGVLATSLVDRIVPLEDLWSRREIEGLTAALVSVDLRRNAIALRDKMRARIGRVGGRDPIGKTAALLHLHAGISIIDLAENHGLTRQQFKRRFLAAEIVCAHISLSGARPLALVLGLSDLAGVASDVGFYDQAQMINEFHQFAGSSPTVFFRPHGSERSGVKLKLRGRPCEWPA